MKILIAEDNPDTTILLKCNLERWGYEVLATENGEEAWEVMEREDHPSLVILDWLMPRMDGIQVCRNIRKQATQKPPYIILLTAKTSQDDIIEGLQAGADDFLTKPFNLDELKARIQVGERATKYQLDLADRMNELQEQLLQVKKLQGFLSVCAYCKKIHAEKKHWEPIEVFISKHLKDTKFSHTICPPCYEKHVVPDLKKLKEEQEEENRKKKFECQNGEIT
jgi:DNA-binding response OmpR family regulator